MSFGRGRGAARRMGVPDEPVSVVPKERRAKTVRRIVAFFRPYRLQVGVVLAAILLTSLLGLINPFLLKLLIDNVIVGKDYALLGPYVAIMIVVPIVTGLIGIGQTYLNNVVGQSVMQDLRNALYAHLQGMPLRFFTETRTGEIQSRLSNDVGGVQAVVTDTAASITSNLAVSISTIVAMFLLSWQLTVISLGLLPFFLYLTYRVGRVRREVSSETQKSLADVSAVTEETLSVSGILLAKTFGQQGNAIAKFRGLNANLARLQIRQAMVGRWFFMIVGTVFSITPAIVYFVAGTLAANGVQNAPTAGDIVAFTTLQSRLFFPLGQLLNVQVEIQGALALFDRIFEYLDMDPEIVDAPDAVALDPQGIRGDVRLHRVWFRYPTAPIPSERALEAAAGGHRHERFADVRVEVRQADPEVAAVEPEVAEPGVSGDGRRPAAARRPGDDGAAAAPGLGAAPPMAGAGDRTTAAATETTDADEAAPDELAREAIGAEAASEARPGFALEDIDFEARPGQLVALVGPSGSGKTTTTYLIPRLYDVDSGAVEIDGHDIRRVTLRSLGEAIGFVTQETYLFHASVRDNLRYAKPDATDDQLEAAASAAAIHQRILELPEGYDTVVGERGYKLSGGEKQRVAIARVLLKDPRVLILDEATSALDTVSERLIQAALEGLMRGRTTIAIAHRLSTILRADQILVYQRGRIVERGTHAELLARGGLYARLYHEQFEAAAEIAAGAGDDLEDGTAGRTSEDEPAHGETRPAPRPEALRPA